MLRKKRGMIEFGWMFAIIVGAVFLLLAFYFIGTKLIEKKAITESLTEHNLDTLFNPFSYFGSLGAVSSKDISLNKIEKINFSCFNDGSFGYNKIISSTYSSSDYNLKTGRKIYDKYIFSDNYTEDRDFQIISKPFEMPWRVADLIYFIPKNKVYCFIDLSSIEEEFNQINTSMNISNFEFVRYEDECSDKSIKVGDSFCDECDINLDSSNNKITKQGDILYFEGDALMYAAIFSDNYIYNCNLKRLAKRLEYQVDIYGNRALRIGERCSVQFNLGSLSSSARRVYDVSDVPAQIQDALNSLSASSENLRSQNYYSECKLF